MSDKEGQNLTIPKGGAIVEDGGGEPSDASTEKVYRLFEYLESAQGHDIATATVKLLADGFRMIEGFKKAALEQSTQHARFEKTLQLVVIVAVLIAVCSLTYFDKFNSPVALLLGTLVGYAFGRK